MSEATGRSAEAIEVAIRLGLVMAIAYVCFRIFAPFLMPVAWAAIIAVALLPLLQRLESWLGGRPRIALGIFTLAALALLIVPTVLLMFSMAEAVGKISHAYQAGEISVPPPPSAVEDWPIIGDRIYETWRSASQNLEATLERFAPQLGVVARWLVGMAAGAGAGVLQFVISVLIAAVLMANAETLGAFARRLGERLAGESGAEFATLATATTRSVAQGVLGVAVIQSLASGLGMLAIGVPAAGLWALLVLVLAIVQLPPLLILGPVIVWVFSAHETVPAVLFAVWGILVSASDTFLKPIFLGRGLDIPMLVILIGAIGGMLFSGVIGLFVGAVVLALGYKLFVAWLEDSAQVAAD